MSADVASRAVLAGVLDVLGGSATFLALSSGGLFSGVSSGAVCPYTVVTASERRYDTFGRNGKEVDVRLHVFSEHGGDDEALRIVASAVALLDDERGQAVKITAAGYTVLQVLYEGDHVMGDELVGGVQVRHRIALFTVRAEVA